MDTVYIRIYNDISNLYMYIGLSTTSYESLATEAQILQRNQHSSLHCNLKLCTMWQSLQKAS